MANLSQTQLTAEIFHQQLVLPPVMSASEASEVESLCQQLGVAEQKIQTLEFTVEEQRQRLRGCSHWIGPPCCDDCDWCLIKVDA